MTRPVVIIGAGGFGREVVAIVRACAAAGFDRQIQGVLDDAPSEQNLDRLARLGLQHLGGLDVLAELGPVSLVVGVGDNSVRSRIVTGVDGLDLDFPRFVHPDATLGGDVSIGEGAVLAPGVRLSTNVHCGRHVHIDQNATASHDVRLGDFSRLSPAVCLAGGVVIGDGALIGAGATVLPGIRVGAQAVVGAGAVVVADVAPRVTVKGVPAR